MGIAFVVDLNMEVVAIAVYIIVEVDLVLCIVSHLDPQRMMYLNHQSMGLSLDVLG